jgi:signal peptidase I
MNTLIKEPAYNSASGTARKKSLGREYFEAIVVAILLALVIRAFVVQAFSIPSGSMLPTLQIGDYLMVNKFVYGIRNPFTNKVMIPVSNPQRDDVIVFIYPQDPEKDYIKRIVGIEGDKIQIINKKLYRNFELVESPFAVYSDSNILSQPGDPPRDNFGPVTVPPHKVFVMGDNRDYSYDGRFWGFVDLDAIRGKAFIIYWSWDRQTFRPRWDRLGMLIR